MAEGGGAPLHGPPTLKLALGYQALPLQVSKRSSRGWHHLGSPNLSTHRAGFCCPWLPGLGQGTHRTRATKAETEEQTSRPGDTWTCTRTGSVKGEVRAWGKQEVPSVGHWQREVGNPELGWTSGGA